MNKPSIYRMFKWKEVACLIIFYLLFQLFGCDIGGPTPNPSTKNNNIGSGFSGMGGISWSLSGPVGARVTDSAKMIDTNTAILYGHFEPLRESFILAAEGFAITKKGDPYDELIEIPKVPPYNDYGTYININQNPHDTVFNAFDPMYNFSYSQEVNNLEPETWYRFRLVFEYKEWPIKYPIISDTGYASDELFYTGPEDERGKCFTDSVVVNEYYYGQNYYSLYGHFESTIDLDGSSVVFGSIIKIIEESQPNLQPKLGSSYNYTTRLSDNKSNIWLIDSTDHIIPLSIHNKYLKAGTKLIFRIDAPYSMWATKLRYNSNVTVFWGTPDWIYFEGDKKWYP